MFDWFRKLFGAGVLRFEVVSVSGKEGTVKTPFIGSFTSEEEMMEEIAEIVFVETGERVKKIRLVGMSGNMAGAKKLTGHWFGLVS